MRLSISHTTRYTYDQPVPYALQQLRLTPKSGHGQTVHSWNVTVEGGQKELSFEDQHHNIVDLISFAPGTSEITVHCSGVIEVEETHGVIGQHGGYMPMWMFLRATEATKVGPLVRKLVSGLSGDPGGLEWLHALSAAILAAVTYETGKSDVGWTAEDALEAGHGVCQDHAHVFIACCRHMGVPARYVSGYLMMNDRIEQEATHAWAEANVDGLGWVGFDVSNGISPDTRYVRAATGLDYAEAAPVSGTRFGTAGEALTVQVQVQQQ
ncbi:transglutaminase family protein [Ruegeria marina]|uniref:Transglutaminase-like enzyme, putative cysteine protease n=1 Tax=Ruegeria marina TaxID=639004 RepID=A0A1G6ZLD8_9RHOB|nr:transglutaminase family protein [Ruegeria marina]SDE03252.1 Transglutaminase-like enzyme, putative cysteine protease [Ruegeria marina]